MSKIEIISETPVSMSELKDNLEAIRNRDGELGFRSGKTQEFLQSVQLSGKSKELVKKIEELNIPRLKHEQVIKIVDLMPKSVDELKIIIQGYTLTISNENLTKIASLLENES